MTISARLRSAEGRTVPRPSSPLRRQWLPTTRSGSEYHSPSGASTNDGASASALSPNARISITAASARETGFCGDAEQGWLPAQSCCPRSQPAAAAVWKVLKNARERGTSSKTGSPSERAIVLCCSLTMSPTKSARTTGSSGRKSAVSCRYPAAEKRETAEAYQLPGATSAKGAA